jgi:hypothetical protein
MADYPELKLLINGEWISRPGQPVINPADETSIGTVPHATMADLAAAVAAAEQGFKVWRNTSPAKRADIILKGRWPSCASASRRWRVAMTLEQGKPIAQSRLEVQRASDIIEWDAKRAAHLWPHHPVRARHAPHRAAPADRTGRRLLAVELSGQLALAQDRRRAVGRLLDHPEGLRGDTGGAYQLRAASTDAGLPAACSTWCTAIRP